MERRNDDDIAFIDGASRTRITFRQLAERVERAATGLRARGVEPGDRVALLVPPSIDLVVAVYACWRAGAVTVVADRGLGLRGLGRAVRSARVQFVLGPGRALAVARAMRWSPGAVHIDVSSFPRLEADAAGLPVPTEPSPDSPAAVLFTSGATGPAKGVRYTHRALAAQRDALRATYDITAHDRLVAAFAPFALYGPALGIASGTPDCDVTKPGSLTAATLGKAVRELEATLAFASPAALANVLATAAKGHAMPTLRTVMSAGAPVPAETLRALRSLAPNATFHTPYGMTEALPVTDIELADIDDAEASGDRLGGVCVGRAVPGADVMIGELLGDPSVIVSSVPSGETGDVLVRAPWLSSGYDRLFRTETDARPLDHLGQVWHRTGDVGHLDALGRLWIEGRSVHVLHTADGVVTPVPIERRVDRELGVARSAVVGVGPVGCQQIVVVLEGSGGDGLASAEEARRTRAAAGRSIAAVLRCKQLPVDIRHNAKIDRTAVARWASEILAGRPS
jgi:olefin beta-lactone synthetase